MQVACLQSWLSCGRQSGCFGPAAARAIVLFGRTFNADEVKARANGLFAVMEQVLKQHTFLVGDHPTLADIANYAYVARAPRGESPWNPSPAFVTGWYGLKALRGLFLWCAPTLTALRHDRGFS